MDLLLARASWSATPLEKPSCLAKRLKVSRHEGLAEGDSGESGGNVVALEGPFDLATEEEALEEVPLGPGTNLFEATLELLV